MQRLLPAAVFVASLVSSLHPPALPAQGKPLTNPALDSLIATKMEEASIMGIGAAIIINDRVVWSQGYGYANIERTRRFTPNSVMNIGSISKTFTGVAMMRAVQDGKLLLDADINRYLPFRVINPKHPDKAITLRHLATHTSGITDRWEVYRDAYHYGGDSPVSLGTFLTDYFTTTGKHYSADNFIDAAPGTMREYSNIGAALAGWIVERAYGEPLNVLTRRFIFAPLGMTGSGWRLSEVKGPNLSTLFVSQGGATIPIPQYGLVTYPDGGVRTSVADLSKFFIALLDSGSYNGRRILSASMTAEMTRYQFDDSNRPVNFPAEDGNSGLFWRTKLNGARVGHSGNDPGVQTEMLADVSKGFGVIFFINTSVSGADQRAASAIFDAVWTWAGKLQESGGT